MPDPKKPNPPERAEDSRPVPSQAEGDEETIDKALEQDKDRQPEAHH